MTQVFKLKQPPRNPRVKPQPPGSIPRPSTPLERLGTPAPVDQNAPQQLILTPTAPDFAGIYTALEGDLAALPSGSWNDLAISGTGTTLMRWVASVGAFGQGSNARSLQEAYLDTARSPSGVYRAVRLQGARLIRRRAGQITVTITRTDNLATPLVIPTLQQWSIGGQPFYNTGPITFSGSGAAVTVTLNRGSITVNTFNSNGTPYQWYALGVSGAWNVGDTDVWMTDSAGTVWQGMFQGLWRVSPLVSQFYESTLPDGTSECKFGDGTYGAIPAPGLLTFTFITLDTNANTQTSPAMGATGVCQGIPVTAVTTTIASANQDPPTPDFYKSVGPGQASNNGRAVTRDDYRAFALQWPGVIDALFRGQAEMNPADLRYMNVVGVTLLTESLWSTGQWLTFKTALQGPTGGMAVCDYARYDPVPVIIDVSLTVAATAAANIQSLTTLINQIVDDFFVPFSGCMGRSIEPSDLPMQILAGATYLQAPGETGALVDYVYQTAPKGPVQLSPSEYPQLGTFTLSIGYTTRNLNAASAGLIAGL